MTDAQLFPIFLKLQGRKVLLVGGGNVAAMKLNALLAVGAEVTLVAPDVKPELVRPGVVVHRREFVPSDLDGAWLVISAAPGAVNREVSKAAEDRRIFVNAVDDPKTGSAYTGGVFRRGGVTFAISTEGQAPALAGLLREGMEAVVPEDLERWVAQAQTVRNTWRQSGVPMSQRRPLLLEALNLLYSSENSQ